MIRVLLADDETLLRSALASLLSMQANISVIAQAANGLEAVELVIRHKPDVVLLDLEMPGLDGLGAAAEILKANQNQAIVLLTRHGRAGVLRRALKVGVLGFVAKSVEPVQLALIISQVAQGRRYIDPEISAAALIDDCPLADRELEVLRLTDEGLSIREMTLSLHLASGTIRNYISSALSKTTTTSRFAAVRVAKSRGWL